MNRTSTMDVSMQQFAACCTKPSFQTFRVIVAMVLKFILHDAPIVAAVDDTLNRKTGKHIGAAGKSISRNLPDRVHTPAENRPR